MSGERVLPNGWKLLPFNQIAESITERVEDPSAAGVDRYVGLDHLDPDSTCIRRWGSPDDVGSTKLRFYPGDVVYARRRAYQRKLGVADFEGICSAHALVLRARPEVCLPEFLPHFLQSDAFHERALDISVGSLSPTINWKTLAIQEFAVPPADFQRDIAVLAAAVEAVGDCHNRAFHSANNLYQAALHAHLAGESTTLGALAGPGGITAGPFGSQLHASDYVDVGTPLINPVDIVGTLIDPTHAVRVSSETLASLPQYRLQVGDVLIARRRAIDRRALVTEVEDGWMLGSDCIRIRAPGSQTGELIFHALMRDDIFNWLSARRVGSVMPGLSTKVVESLPLHLPPERERHRVVLQLRACREFLDACAIALTQAKLAGRTVLRQAVGSAPDVQ